MIHCHGVGGLARKRHVPDEFEILGVNNVNEVNLPTRLVAAGLDVKKLVGGIENRLIHAIRKFYFINDLVILSAHQFDPSEIISSIGDDKLVGVRQINNVVRFTKSLDGVNPFACVEVKNLDRLTILSAKE